MLDIENYNIFDWIGEEELQNLTPKEGKEKFKLFQSRLDTATEELQKLVAPTGLVLDHSRKSLQELNKIIYDEARAFGQSKNFEKPILAEDEVNCTKGIPSLWKSIISDCVIYYSECLNPLLKDVRWESGVTGKRAEDRNWPRLLWTNKDSVIMGNGQTWYFYIYIYRILMGHRGRISNNSHFVINFDYTISINQQ